MLRPARPALRRRPRPPPAPRRARGRGPRGRRPLRPVPAAVPPRGDSPRVHRPGRRPERLHRLPQMRGALPRGRALHGTRLMPDVDVLVVGAGPAGAVAAREAKCAAPELDVALLERDPAPGTPVRCAEGVGDAGLREFADPDGASWVARKITRVILVAPDDTEVKVEARDVGWILDRTRFDAFLADEAGRAGAAVLVESEAAGVRPRADGTRDAGGRNPRGEQMFRARIVIGADGVGAMGGRWAGVEARVPAPGMGSCGQYVV